MAIRISLLCVLTFLCIPKSRAQVKSDSLQIEGNYRTFFYHQPAASEKPQNLVFVMHGSGGNGRDMMRSTEAMEKEAIGSRTLLVYPSGYKRYWNECRKASPALANQEDVNEQAFFSGMIDYFQKKYGIDSKKVFAVGTSGGGHMAYKLALTMPQKFRAVTAIIANLPDTDNMDCVPSGKALPIMIINGTEDNVNPYQGGLVDLGPNMNMGKVRSTDRSFHYWADLAGYRGEPKLKKLPDTDPNDGRTIEKYSYQAPGKPEVVLLKVIGGKHDYPKDIDVHVEALRFFLHQK